MRNFLFLVLTAVFYYTSRNYYVWLVSSILIWIPIVLSVMLLYGIWYALKEIKEWLDEAWYTIKDLFLMFRNDSFNRETFNNVSEAISESYEEAWNETK